MTGHSGWRGRWFGGMRIRILAVVIALLSASSIGSVLVLRGVLLQQLDEEVTAHLDKEAEEFRLLSRGNNPQTGQPFAGDLPAILDTHFSRQIPDEGEALLAFLDGVLYQQLRAQDAAGADDVPAAARYWASLLDEERGVIDTELGPARYVAVPLQGRGQDAVFVVANFPDFERAEIEDALNTQVAITLVSLVLASLVGAILADRVLRPLVTLASTARIISDTDLTRRIPVSGRDEASLIAEAFNDMLARLERVFTSQRQFLDDTSHELRTPLTVISGHVELLELDPSQESRRDTVRLVLDETDRLSRMVDDLLLLARAQQPNFLRLQRLNVVELVQDLHRKLEVLTPLSLVCDVPPGAWIDGDGQRITQAIMQLVTNATTHNNDAAVVLDARVENGHVILAVADDGVGVTAEDATHIFTRSRRGTTTDSAGSGLGLAIVQAIAQAHGGTVRLAADPSPGARFEMLIPVGVNEASTR